jgi:hypothetical protein
VRGPSTPTIPELSNPVLIHSLSEAQVRRGEEPDVDPEQFQDPDNEYGLFPGTTCEADDKEDRTVDSPRRARREARERNWRSSAQSAHSYSNKS